MKVRNFSTGRPKDERVANGRVHAGKLIVLEFQRRDKRNGGKATRHGARELIVRKMKEFHTAISNGGIVGWHRTAQPIVVHHEKFDAQHIRWPIGRQIARETIVGKIQPIDGSQVPTFRDGSREIVVVDTQEI